MAEASLDAAYGDDGTPSRIISADEPASTNFSILEPARAVRMFTVLSRLPPRVSPRVLAPAGRLPSRQGEKQHEPLFPASIAGELVHRAYPPPTFGRSMSLRRRSTIGMLHVLPPQSNLASRTNEPQSVLLHL